MKEEMSVGEYLKKCLKKEAWESIGSAIIFMILGIIIVNNPSATIATFSYIVGGLFILVGVFKTINYFVEKGSKDFFNYDLVYGIIAIVIGIIFVMQFSLLNTIFRILVAVWLIYGALIRGTTSIKMKNFDIKSWWVVLISAVLMLIAGIYIIANANILVMSIGIIMIAYAVIDLIDGILFIFNVNKY